MLVSSCCLQYKIMNNYGVNIWFIPNAAVLIGIAAAIPAKNDAKKNAQNKPCLKTCDLDYKPVCAGEGKDKPKSFGSVCVLDNYNCEHGTSKYTFDF